MPRQRRLGVYACAYVCVAVVLATGCAAPTELSFDSAPAVTQAETQSVTPAEFSPPDELAAPAADVVARPAQPGDSAQPSDSTPQAV